MEFIILITINILFSLILLILFIKQYSSSKKKYEGKTISEIYEDSITNANLESKKLLEEAAVKAKLILDDTNSFKTTIENYAEQNLKDKYQEFESKLSANSTQIINLYNTLFHNLQSEVQQKESELIYKIESNSNSAIAEIDFKIKNEIAGLFQNIQQNLAKEFEDSKEIINEYRNAQKQEIDRRVLAEVQRLTKKIFSSTITYEQHEAIIIKALEQAKKEGLFI